MFRKLSDEEKNLVQEYTLVNFMESSNFNHQNDVEEIECELSFTGENEDSFQDERQKRLADFEMEIEQLKEEARQAGYELGYQDGYEDGKTKGEKEAREEFQEEYSQLLKKLEDEVLQSITQVEREKQEFLDRHIENLKNISLSVAEKIIQISLKSSEEVIKRMILVATEKTKKKEWAKIYIGTSGQSIQVQGDPNFMKELSNLSENIKVIMMNEQEYGTCIVELPDEIMDISVTTQLENIKDILNNAKLLRHSEEL